MKKPLLIFLTFTTFFFGIKAENSITLAYYDGETETICFEEKDILSFYEQNRLLNIAISLKSEKTPLTTIFLGNRNTTFISDITELTTVGLRFEPEVLDKTRRGLRTDLYPVSITNENEGAKVRFTITGFQNIRPPEIKEISGSFSIPVFKKQYRYPAYWSDLQLPKPIPTLLTPIVREKRQYAGGQLANVLLSIGDSSQRKIDGAAQKLLSLGFRISDRRDGFTDYKHPDFKGKITLYPYTYSEKYNVIEIDFDY